MTTVHIVVVTDWLDGPIGGIATLGEDETYWHFRLFAENPGSDDLDDRLFVLSEVPAAHRAELRRVAGTPVVSPLIWPYDHEPDPSAVDRAVQDAITSAAPPHLVLRSSDLNQVTAVWYVSDPAN